MLTFKINSIFFVALYYENPKLNRLLHTVLLELCQRHRKNVIHDFAYHHQSYFDFPLDKYVVLVLICHCTLTLDPNPKRNNKMKYGKILKK